MGRNFERARRDSLGRARDGTNRRKIAQAYKEQIEFVQERIRTLKGEDDE